MGAAYGTAKSGVGIASMGVMRPELVMKSIVPVVMAGVLGIYGLIIAVIITTGSTLKFNFFKFHYFFRIYLNLNRKNDRFANHLKIKIKLIYIVSEDGYTLFMGYGHLGAGLSCGLAGLAAGMAIGIVGDAGVRYDNNKLHN